MAGAADWFGLLYGPGSLSDVLAELEGILRGECDAPATPETAFAVLAAGQHLGYFRERLDGFQRELGDHGRAIVDQALLAEGL